MKRINLTLQLVLIYTAVLIITTITFYSLLSSWLQAVYTDINYTKLDDFASTAKNVIEGGYDLNKLHNENIEYIVWSDEVFYYSEDFFEIMDVNYLITSYEQIQLALETQDVYRGTLNKGEYFYSTIKTSDGNYYIFTVSQGFLIEEMRSTTGSRIMGIFFLILISGGLIIGAWSNLVVVRIGKISNHVKYMPENNYKKSLKDEIGVLADCIESMREQIYDNEETKKEILQNLSHDLKTPLAVIKSYAEAIVDGIESPESGLLIIKQAGILQHKVEKLLELNRLNYLEEDNNFIQVNMKKIILKVVDSHKYMTNLKFDLSLDDSIFIGYEENFTTVVENIISNALRYATTTISITLKDDILTISNDGEHIEDKFIDGKFKAYEKGSKGIFGVGMSIVKQTLDFFDFDLKVQNEEIGVSFIIKKRKKH